MEREYGPEGQIIIRDIPEAEPTSYGRRMDLRGLFRFYWPAIFMLLAIIATGAGIVVAWTSSSDSSSELTEEELAALVDDATSPDDGGVYGEGTITPVEPAAEVRSIEILSEPAGASVYVNLEPVGTTPLRDYLLPEGVHVLSVSTVDGARVDTVVLLDETSQRTFFFAPQPLEEGAVGTEQASIAASSPEINSVEPARRDESNTQQRGDASAQEPDPQPAADEAVTGESSGPVQPVEDAAPDPMATGELVITSSPSGALVEIDGERRGTTPLHARGIEPGEHELKVTLEGHSEAHEVLAVRAGDTELRTYELRPLLGTVAVQVRPWGSIYVDGELRARDLDVRHEMQLSIGTHRLTAVHPVLGRQELEIQVRAGQTREITIDLSNVSPGDQ